MFEDKTLEYKGCSIFYCIETKEKADKWAIFLHGAGVDHRMFMDQVKAVPNEFNILMWDARSHGNSVPNKSKFSMKQLMEDLLKIMEVEKISKAVFIGQSMEDIGQTECRCIRSKARGKRICSRMLF